jgi:hypothetical protein
VTQRKFRGARPRVNANHNPLPDKLLDAIRFDQNFGDTGVHRFEEYLGDAVCRGNGGHVKTSTISVPSQKLPRVDLPPKRVSIRYTHNFSGGLFVGRVFLRF